MKVFTAILTVVLALSFGATALAQADGLTPAGISDAAQGGFGTTAAVQSDTAVGVSDAAQGGFGTVAAVLSDTAVGVSDAAQGGFGTVAAVLSDTAVGVSDAAQGGFGATVVQSAADSLAVPSPGGGLGAFVIVLISLGGAVLLASVAYGGTRVAHRRTA